MYTNIETGSTISEDEFRNLLESQKRKYRKKDEEEDDDSDDTILGMGLTVGEALLGSIMSNDSSPSIDTPDFGGFGGGDGGGGGASSDY